VIANEAVHWARHFAQMEGDIDDPQVRLFGAAEAQVRDWTADGHSVSGPQSMAAGLAELLEIG
jgi:hypothetical protein